MTDRFARLRNNPTEAGNSADRAAKENQLRSGFSSKNTIAIKRSCPRSFADFKRLNEKPFANDLRQNYEFRRAQRLRVAELHGGVRNMPSSFARVTLQNGRFRHARERRVVFRREALFFHAFANASARSISSAR